MCLITFSPEGPEKLDWHTLNHSGRHMNDDGFGGAWYDYETDAWQVFRSVRNYKKLFNALAYVPKDAPIVIHQRYATHGRVTIENAHPFDCGRGVLLFHNGTISGTRADSGGWSKKVDGTWSKDKGAISDTRAFVEDELGQLIAAAGHKWLAKPGGRAWIENRIGSGNVLVVCVPGNPEPLIYNEKRGDWETYQGAQIYYSNQYSRPYASRVGFYRGMYAYDDPNDWTAADYERWAGGGKEGATTAKRSNAMAGTVEKSLADQVADYCGVADDESQARKSAEASASVFENAPTLLEQNEARLRILAAASSIPEEGISLVTNEQGEVVNEITGEVICTVQEFRASVGAQFDAALDTKCNVSTTLHSGGVIVRSARPALPWPQTDAHYCGLVPVADEKPEETPPVIFLADRRVESVAEWRDPRDEGEFSEAAIMAELERDDGSWPGRGEPGADAEAEEWEAYLAQEAERYQKRKESV